MTTDPETPSPQGQSAIVIDGTDTVATAIRDLAAGTVVRLDAGARTQAVTVTQPIAYGHKFALCEIASGAAVIKYGAAIGTATRAIGTGEHVHSHNLEGSRFRGDRAGG